MWPVCNTFLKSFEDIGRSVYELEVLHRKHFNIGPL